MWTLQVGHSETQTQKLKLWLYGEAVWDGTRHIAVLVETSMHEALAIKFFFKTLVCSLQSLKGLWYLAILMNCFYPRSGYFASRAVTTNNDQPASPTGISSSKAGTYHRVLVRAPLGTLSMQDMFTRSPQSSFMYIPDYTRSIKPSIHPHPSYRVQMSTLGLMTVEPMGRGGARKLRFWSANADIWDYMCLHDKNWDVCVKWALCFIAGKWWTKYLTYLLGRRPDLNMALSIGYFWLALTQMKKTKWRSQRDKKNILWTLSFGMLAWIVARRGW
jgi:hypothetical protein